MTIYNIQLAPRIEDNNKTTYDGLYRAARAAQKRLDIMVAEIEAQEDEPDIESIYEALQ